MGCALIALMGVWSVYLSKTLVAGCRFGRSSREFDTDRQGVRLRAICPHFSPVIGDDALSDGQPESVTAGLAVSGVIDAIEAVEQSIQGIRRHGLLDGIGDGTAYGVAFFFKGYGDLSPFWCVFQGVVQQDGKKLADGTFVAGP